MDEGADVMDGPLKPWERMCLRILLWGGMLNGVIFTVGVVIDSAKAFL